MEPLRLTHPLSNSPARLRRSMPDADTSALTAAIHALTQASNANSTATQARLGEVLAEVKNVGATVGAQAQDLATLKEWRKSVDDKLGLSGESVRTQDRWRGGLAVGLVVLGLLQALAAIEFKSMLDDVRAARPFAGAPRSP